MSCCHSKWRYNRDPKLSFYSSQCFSAILSHRRVTRVISVLKMKPKKNDKKDNQNTIVKKRKAYNQESLKNAIEAVKKGMSKKLASKTFNVPRGTIQCRLKNVNCKDLPGPNPVLDKEEEDALVRWLNECCRKGFPKRKIDLQLSVASFIKKAGRKNPFKNGFPGKKWNSLFMRRHPELSERTPESVTSASAAVSEQDIKGWFSNIESYLKDNDYYEVLSDPSRIFNGDESNFQLCPKSGKVLALRGERDVYEVDHAAAKSALTVLFTFGANGDITPPLVVFPNKRLPKDITSTVPGEWGIGLSDSGWMKAELFYDYIKNVFHPYLLRTQRKFPIILFVDGHKTHLSIDVSELCRSLDIVLIALYPNATRLLQPADVAAFRPLKLAWKNSVLQWRRDHPLETLTKNNFVPLLKDALENGVQPSTVINGFRTTGLYPWNSEAINYKKCLGKGSSETKKSTKEEQKVMTKDILHQLVGTQKMTALQNVSIDSLSDSDKILKKICNFFQNNEKDNTAPVLNDSIDLLTNDLEGTSTNNVSDYVNINNLPLLFFDDLVTSKSPNLIKDNIETNLQNTLDDINEIVVNAEKRVTPSPNDNKTETIAATTLEDNQKYFNKQCLTPIKIQDVLVKQKTPQRKGIRQVARSSFVLTSDEWHKGEIEKYNVKKIKEEQIETRKKERLQKLEEKKILTNVIKKQTSKKQKTKRETGSDTLQKQITTTVGEDDKINTLCVNNLSQDQTHFLIVSHEVEIHETPLSKNKENDKNHLTSTKRKMDRPTVEEINEKELNAQKQLSDNKIEEIQITSKKQKVEMGQTFIPPEKKIQILSDQKVIFPLRTNTSKVTQKKTEDVKGNFPLRPKTCKVTEKKTEGEKEPSTSKITRKKTNGDVLDRFIENASNKTVYSIDELQRILSED